MAAWICEQDASPAARAIAQPVDNVLGGLALVAHVSRQDDVNVRVELQRVARERLESDTVERRVQSLNFGRERIEIARDDVAGADACRGDPGQSRAGAEVQYAGA